MSKFLKLVLFCMILAIVQPVHGFSWSAIKKAAKKAAKQAAAAAAAAAEAAAAAAEDVVEEVSDAVSDAVDTVTDVVEDVADTVSDAAEDVADAVTDAANWVFDEVTDYVFDESGWFDLLHSDPNNGCLSKVADGVTQDPPEISPYDLSIVADAAQYLGAEQAHLDKWVTNQAVTSATVLATKEITNQAVFSDSWVLDFLGVSGLTQDWNLVLSSYTRSSDGTTGYIISIQGTDYFGNGVLESAGDWISNVKHYFYPSKDVMQDMRDQIATWMNNKNIATIDILTGHSAGGYHAKYIFSESQLAQIGDPWIVTWQAYDPKTTCGAKMIDVRNTGDVVSACFGPREPISVCTCPDADDTKDRLTNTCGTPTIPNANPDILHDHDVISMDLNGVTWPMLGRGRYGFVGGVADVAALLSGGVSECNIDILGLGDFAAEQATAAAAAVAAAEHADGLTADQIALMADLGISADEQNAYDDANAWVDSEELGWHYNPTCWGAYNGL